MQSGIEARGRRRAIKALAGTLIAAASGALPAFAATSTVGPVVLSIPEGFANAQSQRRESMQIAAWSKSTRSDGTKTLLQVSIYDAGSPLKNPSSKQLAEGSEKYLRDFLGGIERRREKYVLSPVDHIKLAGLPAARATWQGSIGSVAAVGVMYCVIVENQFIVSFHTQDLGSTPTASMREAMKSIEAVRLARGHE